MWSIKRVVIVVLVLTPGLLFAQDSTQLKRTKGLISLGGSSSSGNINVFSTNALLELSYASSKTNWDFESQYLNYYRQETKINENFESSVIRSSSIIKKTGYYLKVSAYRNVFRGFALQWKEGVGLLHHFVKKDDFNLSSRVGYQLRQNQIASGILDNFHNGKHHFSQLGMRTSFPVMENVTFQFQIDYEMDVSRVDNFYFDMLTNLTMKVNKSLSVRLNHKYFYAGIPVIGKVPKDRSFSGSLVVNF